MEEIGGGGSHSLLASSDSDVTFYLVQFYQLAKNENESDWKSCLQMDQSRYEPMNAREKDLKWLK